MRSPMPLSHVPEALHPHPILNPELFYQVPVPDRRHASFMVPRHIPISLAWSLLSSDSKDPASNSPPSPYVKILAGPHIEMYGMDLVVLSFRWSVQGLWISGKGGPDVKEHSGNRIQGFNLAAQDEPVIFDARRLLHASQDWPEGTNRVVLIAWTVVHARSLPLSVAQQLYEAGFQVPTPTDLSTEVPNDWMPAPIPPVAKRLKQTSLSFRHPERNNHAVHRLVCRFGREGSLSSRTSFLYWVLSVLFSHVTTTAPLPEASLSLCQPWSRCAIVQVIKT